MSVETEVAIFGDSEIPKNGVVITLDDEKLGYFDGTSST